MQSVNHWRDIQFSSFKSWIHFFLSIFFCYLIPLYLSFIPYWFESCRCNYNFWHMSIFSISVYCLTYEYCNVVTAIILISFFLLFYNWYFVLISMVHWNIIQIQCAVDNFFLLIFSSFLLAYIPYSYTSVSLWKIQINKIIVKKKFLNCFFVCCIIAIVRNIFVQTFLFLQISKSIFVDDVCVFSFAIYYFRPPP